MASAADRAAGDAPGGGPDAPPSDPGPGRPGHASGRGRAAVAAVSVALVALPFLAVTFPPVADLPQHVAQVRLLGEALADPGSPYRVQWLTPYSLVYAVFGLAWTFAGPVAAGRYGMLAVAALWAAAVHLLAWRRRRPAAAAALASLLVFNQSLYWGFAPFLLGWPAFVAWFLLTRRAAPPPGRRLREALLFAGGALLLYVSHALWLAAGVAWLAVDAAIGRRPARELAPRIAGVVPAAALAAVWFGELSGTSFATPPLWVDPLRRLRPEWLVEAAFGGLRGGLETLGLLAVLGWLLAALLGHRRRLRDAIDPSLAALAVTFLAAALLAPDKFTNTIEFNTRWMPPALAAALLAAPPLRLRPAAARGIAVALLAGWTLVTATVWRRIERVELAGLAPALAALPPAPRVLGLDYVRTSRWLDHQPYLQTFAWAQAIHGGTLNFSFADFPPSLVVYSPPRRAPWSGGLEWYPQRLRDGDLAHFNHMLVRADAALHARIAGDPATEPATTAGDWRLYRLHAREATAGRDGPGGAGPD